MDNKTPTAKKQLSSSLRERLKKCGRYHASPRADNTPGTSTAKIQQTATNIDTQANISGVVQTCEKTEPMFVSPLSRKRTSSSELCESTNSSKRAHSDVVCLENEDHLDDKSAELSDSVKGLDNGNESIKAQSNTCTPLAEVNRTPLTSRSRFKQHQLKTNRQIFQKSEITSNLQVSEKSHCDSGSSQICSTTTTAAATSSSSTTVESDKVVKENSNSCSKSGHVVNSASDSGKAEGAVTVTRASLLREISEKEEKLRKLKMVKTYRTKNNLAELQALIDKWRQVSQEALQDLHAEMSDPKPTLTQLVDHLGIEHELLNFDPEEETFEQRRKY